MSNKSKNNTSTIRLIAGQWRGRKLAVANVSGLRPTSDRLRETLFNWLAPDLHGARCLDLFAGTGALSLEVLSRGAKSVQCCELNKLAADQLRQNAQLLNASDLHLFNGDAFAYIEQNPNQIFDIIFIDPPFADNVWQRSINTLIMRDYLDSASAIYVESTKNIELDIPTPWYCAREKSMGNVLARLYRRDTDEEAG